MNSVNSTIVSTRLRLARNVVNMPFPHKIKEQQARQIADDVTRSLIPVDRFTRYDMSGISPLDAVVLREKHLISPDLTDECKYGVALINSDETVSVMVNEEDHIREQVILPGLALDQAFDKVNGIDDILSKNISFAFDSRFGYLTSCATNLGTGMRASVMMFLPALTMANMIDGCIADIGRFNMTVRGVYGEGSKADGFLYQISNQRTLGVKESDILGAVKGAINLIVDAELRARQMLRRDEPTLRDRIYRAWGVATNAYKLSTAEAMQYLAMIRLGGYYGYIDIADEERLQNLFTNCQPGNVQKSVGEGVDSDGRDICRARRIASALYEICRKNN